MCRPRNLIAGLRWSLSMVPTVWKQKMPYSSARRHIHPCLQEIPTKLFKTSSHQVVRGTFHISRVCHLTQFCLVVGRCISISARGSQKKNRYPFSPSSLCPSPWASHWPNPTRSVAVGNLSMRSIVAHFSGQ